MKMKAIGSFVLVFVPLYVLACYQFGAETHQIQNNDIKAKLTYNNKPIANAFVVLQTKKKVLSSTHTAENGWFAFKDVAPGEYRVTLVSPSHESFDVVMRASREHRTKLVINFYADWCNNVIIVPDG